MKKIFTLISLALVAMSVNAQVKRVAKYCVPADFDLTEYHKIIDAIDETTNEKIGTIEILSSPNKNDLFEELKDEYGEKILDENGMPQFDMEHPKAAWDWKCNDPNSNMSLSIWEEGFGYGIIGKGNPVMSQNEGWEQNDEGAWSYKVTDAVYWTPGCGALPAQGEWIKVTPNEDGAVTVGVFMNKGGGDSGHGHRLYIIDESTADQGYQVIAPKDIKVQGSFQNNGWSPAEKKIVYNAETDTWENVTDEEGNDVMWYPWGEDLSLPFPIIMTENYSVFEYTNQKGEVTFFNRPFLGLVSFEVKKDVSYWMLNPTSQLGFYGFKLYVGGTLDDVQDANGVAAIKADATDANAPIYNLAGQKVGKDFKGLVIQNGKKFVVK